MKINEMIQESIEAKKKINVREVEKAAEIIIDALKNGKKVLIAGNGGSAADSQHFAAELIGRFKKERKSYAGIALTTDSSILTCLGNDYGFDKIFARQVEGLGKEGDVFFGISTSGNSPNIINAIEKAKEMGVKTISLLGKDGGKMKGMSDLDIIVGAKDTPRIQEAHITIIHIICEIVENEMMKNER